jgi:hypothetical protein
LYTTWQNWLVDCRIHPAATTLDEEATIDVHKAVVSNQDLVFFLRRYCNLAEDLDCQLEGYNFFLHLPQNNVTSRVLFLLLMGTGYGGPVHLSDDDYFKVDRFPLIIKFIVSAVPPSP